MKISRLIFGLLLAVGVGRSIGAPTKEAQFSTAPRKESPALSEKKQGSTPVAPEVDSGRRGGLEDTLEIIGVTEQKPDASGSRKVTVRVRYALVHYPKGVLSLGFNLKSATHFVQVATQPVMAGMEEIELSAKIVPVAWPKPQAFKVSVSLSAEPHPGQWSMLAASSLAMKPTAAPVPAR